MDEISSLNEKINTLELAGETASAEYRQVSKRKGELLVQHDVLQLDVKQLRDSLKSVSERVLELEGEEAAGAVATGPEGARYFRVS